MSAKICALAFACTVACGSTFAYGPNGHLEVGAIADAMIAGTPTATQVRKILGSTLRTASVWADCAKGVSPTTFKYGGEGRYAECAIYENTASERQMEAFVRRNVGNCTSRFNNTEPCHKQYHYTDVAVQRVAYEKGKVGTTDQDVVSAIAATIAVLQGKPCPPPFDITSKKEALRLLSHYVGDIHQPLHVVAVYVDATGKVVDPDEGPFDADTETHGGNDLLIGSKKLHSEWDTVASSLASQPPSAALMTLARAVPVTAGDMSGWSTAWATETLTDGKVAFDGVTYAAADAHHHHGVTLPAGYSKLKTDVQRKEIARAGARLAQVLTAIWH
ncbi:S1/P1 nuclease [Variovorax sp. dw_954]|uniref:S1/P1 nuclease n=1 Tax=Variovorax sp. dw_954 TaxID=2720078 RepID=UPI001BD2CC79|nr:S1/P1 nuclease [Variovorax sp. dw_954]